MEVDRDDEVEEEGSLDLIMNNLDEEAVRVLVLINKKKKSNNRNTLKKTMDIQGSDSDEEYYDEESAQK